MKGMKKSKREQARSKGDRHLKTPVWEGTAKLEAAIISCGQETCYGSNLFSRFSSTCAVYLVRERRSRARLSRGGRVTPRLSSSREAGLLTRNQPSEVGEKFIR